MISIDKSAEHYLNRLLKQQDEPGMGLRVRVLNPGTPHASCDLQFCPEDHHKDSDHAVSFEGFNLYVAEESHEWLEEAEIIFDEDEQGGQLTIKAPNIKGSQPDDDAPLMQRVSWVIDTEINPGLASHGGRTSLVEITEAGEVILQFGGGCHGCGMVGVTLQQGIEKTLKERFPEITAVKDATDHTTGANPYYA